MTMRCPSWITRYRPPVHPCAATSLRSACGPSVRVVPSACDQKGSSVKRTRKPTSTVQFQWAAAFATVQRMARVAKQRNGSKRCGRRRRRRRLLFRCSRVVVDVGGGGAAVHRSRRGAARGALLYACGHMPWSATLAAYVTSSSSTSCARPADL